MAKTNTEMSFYGESQQIESQGCFAISFHRPTGSNPVNISGFDLAEGQTLSIQQNVGDEDYSNYDVAFDSGAGENQLYVIKIMPVDRGNG